MSHAFVRVKNEEIIIHPTAFITEGRRVYVEARIIGEVEIKGKKYAFNKVIKVRVAKVVAK